MCSRMFIFRYFITHSRFNTHTILMYVCTYICVRVQGHLLFMWLKETKVSFTMDLPCINRCQSRCLSSGLLVLVAKVRQTKCVWNFRDDLHFINFFFC